jgi:hypothetical protein
MMLTKIMVLPKELSLDQRGYLSKWKHKVFQEDLETISWMIGDMMAVLHAVLWVGQHSRLSHRY